MEKTNVLFFLSDQHNPGVTGYAGNKTVDTPTLDKLASESVRFDTCYCQNPLCVPSRYSLLTGKYSKTIGVYDNRHIFESGQNTLPRVLTKAGYETCLIGKAHINGEQFQGYSQRPYGDLFGQAHQPNPSREANGGESGLGDVLGASGPLQFPLAMSQTEICVSEAAKWLSLHADLRADKPFFLSVNFDKPHFPMTPPKQLYDKYVGRIEPSKIPDGFFENAVPFVQSSIRANGAFEHYGKDRDVHLRSLAAYYGCVEWVDGAIGRILDVLEYLGLAKNTVVIYSSDHGEMMGKFGAWQKSLFYDSSCRVPLLIRAPGASASVCKAPVGLIDLYPTICGLCGVEAPPECEGESLLPVIHGEGVTDRGHIFAESAVYKRPEFAGCMLRTNRYKYNRYLDGAEELYDMESDPEEEKNLAGQAEYDSVISDLRERVIAFWEPGKQRERYDKTPMASREKHFYPYSNQFMTGDGTVFDARP